MNRIVGLVLVSAVAACGGSSGSKGRDLGATADLSASADLSARVDLLVGCPSPTPNACATAGAEICVNLQTDVHNCGACDTACGGGTMCENGVCVTSCATDYSACGTYCANLTDDANNCGSCGTGCENGASCHAGHCTLSCEGGLTACVATPDGGSSTFDGGVEGLFCANLHTDNENCGACGRACSDGTACEAGLCTLACQPGLTACEVDGGVNGTLCANLQSDDGNCGGCGSVCALGSKCVSGSCIGTCGNLPPGYQSLLLVGGPSSPEVLQGQLMATGSFCPVDFFNAHAATPSAVQLKQYQAILVYNDLSGTFANATAVGNLVADYFDGGGRVVIALFADGGYGIGGRFISGGYNLLVPTNAGSSNDTLGTIAVAGNAIMTGVTTLNATGAWHTNQTIARGTLIASWHSGDPLVVAGLIEGRQRVDLNILPNDIAIGAVTGNGITLLRNALLYH
jgi:hypothetical protein